MIPDVKANWEALERMISAGQEVVSHNMETVGKALPQSAPASQIRTQFGANKRTKEYGKRTKTGIMLGLGELKEEVYQAMDALVENGCDVLTLGQYLQPTKMHIEVAEFIHPDIFAEYKEIGLAKGFKFVGKWSIS